MDPTADANALSALGVSAVLEQSYRALVSASPTSVAAFARRAGVDEDTARGRLEQLADLGFAIPGRDGWRPLPMLPALESLRAQRQAEIDAAIELAARLDARLALATQPETGGVRTVVGAQPIRSELTTLLEQAVVEVLNLDRPPHFTAVTADDELLPIYEAAMRGVAVRTVYDPSVDPERPQRFRRLGDAVEMARIAPIPLKLLVIDRATAVFTAPADEGGPRLCVVRDRGVAESLAALFTSVWDSAVPLTAGSGEATRQATFLALLTSGCTDAVIASRLSVTERTVRRWVAELMGRYGVRTRLQLGAALMRDPAVAVPPTSSPGARA